MIANVTVTVKEIPDEAVDNSGSIRFMGITKENFIKPGANVRRIRYDQFENNFKTFCCGCAKYEHEVLTEEIYYNYREKVKKIYYKKNSLHDLQCRKKMLIFSPY